MEGMPPVRNTFLTRSLGIGNYSSCPTDLAAVLSAPDKPHVSTVHRDRNPIYIIRKICQREDRKNIFFDLLRRNIDR